ncbi:unnamed protein product [Cuscuta campestris]|uniref:Uncharacterized protein n=1 Tax=Cuscuta campestris TaxID=132261 RepID=A0A484LPY5_9ASTE|nr:unnamed protein product [Cuscuta campestris]
METRAARAQLTGKSLPRLLLLSHPSLIRSGDTFEGNVSGVIPQCQPKTHDPEIKFLDFDEHSPVGCVKRCGDFCEMYNQKADDSEIDSLGLCEKGQIKNPFAGYVFDEMRRRLYPSNTIVEGGGEFCREFSKNQDQDGFLNCKKEELPMVKDLKLCSYCKQKWQNGHKCRGTLNAVSGNEETEQVSEAEAPVAMGHNTIRLVGNVSGKSMVILIDSGSTHSFLDPEIVKDLNLSFVETEPLNVIVANGTELSCKFACPKFKWTVEGEPFEMDMRLLRMGGCDMVLGMDWVAKFAPVELTTRPLSVAFVKGGRRVQLHGIPPS